MSERTVLFQYQECVLYLTSYSASKLDYFSKLSDNTMTMQSTIQFLNSNREITVPNSRKCLVHCDRMGSTALTDPISGHEP